MLLAEAMQSYSELITPAASGVAIVAGSLLVLGRGGDLLRWLSAVAGRLSAGVETGNDEPPEPADEELSELAYLADDYRALARLQDRADRLNNEAMSDACVTIGDHFLRRDVEFDTTEADES